MIGLLARFPDAICYLLPPGGRVAAEVPIRVRSLFRPPPGRPIASFQRQLRSSAQEAPGDAMTENAQAGTDQNELEEELRSLSTRFDEFRGRL